MQNPQVTEFELTSPETAQQRVVLPIEPLYSLLFEAPASALKAVLKDLNDFTDESALEDMYQSLSVNRRTMLEQVNLVMRSRNI